MVLAFNCFSLHRKRYLESTIPAGHVLPPQPSVRSCFRVRGGLRSPEKSRVMVSASCSEREGTRSCVISPAKSVSWGSLVVCDSMTDSLFVQGIPGCQWRKPGGH